MINQQVNKFIYANSRLNTPTLIPVLNKIIADRGTSSKEGRAEFTHYAQLGGHLVFVADDRLVRDAQGGVLGSPQDVLVLSAIGPCFEASREDASYLLTPTGDLDIEAYEKEMFARIYLMLHAAYAEGADAIFVPLIGGAIFAGKHSKVIGERFFHIFSEACQDFKDETNATIECVFTVFPIPKNINFSSGFDVTAKSYLERNGISDELSNDESFFQADAVNKRIIIPGKGSATIQFGDMCLLARSGAYKKPALVIADNIFYSPNVGGGQKGALNNQLSNDGYKIALQAMALKDKEFQFVDVPGFSDDNEIPPGIIEGSRRFPNEAIKADVQNIAQPQMPIAEANEGISPPLVKQTPAINVEKPVLVKELVKSLEEYKKQKNIFKRGFDSFVNFIFLIIKRKKNPQTNWLSLEKTKLTDVVIADLKKRIKTNPEKEIDEADKEILRSFIVKHDELVESYKKIKPKKGKNAEADTKKDGVLGKVISKLKL